VKGEMQRDKPLDTVKSLSKIGRLLVIIIIKGFLLALKVLFRVCIFILIDRPSVRNKIKTYFSRYTISKPWKKSYP
jgi:hypothetical protein